MYDKTLAFYQQIGARIREIRIEKEMSQADLAEKAGLSLPVISNIENAHSKIWLQTFAKIAEALEVSPDDILRLNTPGASDTYPDELRKILNGCTSQEAASIIEVAKQLKRIFEDHKRDYLE